MTSEKSKTNKKWTSSDDYADNYDRIFSKEPQKDAPAISKMKKFSVVLNNTTYVVEAETKLGAIELASKFDPWRSYGAIVVDSVTEIK